MSTPNSKLINTMNSVIQGAVYKNYFRDSLESLLDSIKEPVKAVTFSLPTEDTPYLAIQLPTIKDLSNMDAVMTEYCPLFSTIMSLSISTVSGGVMHTQTIYRDGIELDALILRHTLLTKTTQELDGTKISIPIKSVQMAECIDIVNSWQKKNTPVINSPDLVL